MRPGLIGMGSGCEAMVNCNLATLDGKKFGGDDGARTRDLRRDRPAF